jgi:hypothetical protein
MAPTVIAPSITAPRIPAQRNLEGNPEKYPPEKPKEITRGIDEGRNLGEI